MEQCEMQVEKMTAEFKGNERLKELKGMLTWLWTSLPGRTAGWSLGAFFKAEAQAHEHSDCRMIMSRSAVI